MNSFFNFLIRVYNSILNIYKSLIDVVPSQKTSDKSKIGTNVFSEELRSSLEEEELRRLLEEEKRARSLEEEELRRSLEGYHINLAYDINLANDLWTEPTIMYLKNHLVPRKITLEFIKNNFESLNDYSLIYIAHISAVLFSYYIINSTLYKTTLLYYTPDQDDVFHSYDKKLNSFDTLRYLIKHTKVFEIQIQVVINLVDKSTSKPSIRIYVDDFEGCYNYLYNILMDIDERYDLRSDVVESISIFIYLPVLDHSKLDLDRYSGIS